MGDGEWCVPPATRDGEKRGDVRAETWAESRVDEFVWGRQRMICANEKVVQEERDELSAEAKQMRWIKGR